VKCIHGEEFVSRSSRPFYRRLGSRCGDARSSFGNRPYSPFDDTGVSSVVTASSVASPLAKLTVFTPRARATSPLSPLGARALSVGCFAPALVVVAAPSPAPDVTAGTAVVVTASSLGVPPGEYTTRTPLTRSPVLSSSRLEGVRTASAAVIAIAASIARARASASANSLHRPATPP